MIEQGKLEISEKSGKKTFVEKVRRKSGKFLKKTFSQGKIELFCKYLKSVGILFPYCVKRSAL